MLIPGQSAPELQIETVGHGRFDLSDNVPPEGTLVVFYRGEHCPICRNLLKALDDQIGDFALRGVQLIAISGDGRDKALETINQMQIIRLPIGIELSMKSAREDWGLFLSDAREGKNEPDVFCEPGLFWIGSDGVLKFSVVQTLPFIRPSVPEILKAIDAALSTKKFPPRGGYTGAL